MRLSLPPRNRQRALSLLLGLVACQKSDTTPIDTAESDEAHPLDTHTPTHEDTDNPPEIDTDTGSLPPVACTPKPTPQAIPAFTAPLCRTRAGSDPFADCVVSVDFGPLAGFGQNCFPDIVFGPPKAGAAGGGGTDVLSLGTAGQIVLSFTDVGIIDGPGPDLAVFENPFPGWAEPAEVSVSTDGMTWQSWPCAFDDAASGYPGCAGVTSVHAGDPNDYSTWGGDLFDLAQLDPVPSAPIRYVRITDKPVQPALGGTSEGFDLDALAVLNGAAL